MTESGYLLTAILLPFELLLPLLGILLIRSQSPTNGLIYRSFLGSIAALIYALIGAPDVALTEVLIGTLLSMLLYIVTIKSCYTVVMMQDSSALPDDQTLDHLLQVFAELHLKPTTKDFIDSNQFSISEIFSECQGRSGSPQAFIRHQTLYVESNVLKSEIIESDYFQNNPFLDSVIVLDSKEEES